jgi:hypothetical protein
MPVATAGSETAVTLLPVHTPTPEHTAPATQPCIEVMFSRATVRICGVPEATALRMVLDCLARRL